MDLLSVKLGPDIEWEVPGDSFDAICSSDEEKDVMSAMKLFKTATGCSQPKSKAKTRATTTSGQGLEW